MDTPPVNRTPKKEALDLHDDMSQYGLQVEFTENAYEPEVVQTALDQRSDVPGVNVPGLNQLQNYGVNGTQEIRNGGVEIVVIENRKKDRCCSCLTQTALVIGGLAAILFGAAWLVTFAIPGAIVGGGIGGCVGYKKAQAKAIAEVVPPGVNGVDNAVNRAFAGLGGGCEGLRDGAYKGAFFSFILAKMAFKALTQ